MRNKRLRRRRNILVIIEHHNARIDHLDRQSADEQDHILKPFDPDHFLHHLTHKDISPERGQRVPEGARFYTYIAETHIAEAVASGRGHRRDRAWRGHSNVADRLVAFLKLHHSDTVQKVTRARVAYLSSLTPPQLLAPGRRTLSSSPGQAE